MGRDKERRRISRAAWRKRNPDKVKKSKKNYYNKNRKKVLDRVALWSKEHPRRWYAAHLQREFGITIELFDMMLVAQLGLCIICLLPMTGLREPCVDHDHKTGKVRGLLCSNCNAGLGHFQDNPASLGRAIKYLRGKVT